jgi:putative copper export protein
MDGIRSIRPTTPEMHRLRSRSTIHRLRFAALLICAKCVMIPVSGVLLAYSIVVHDDELTMIAMGLVLLTMVVVFLQWLVAARTACPLCLTPVLAKKDCMKHRHARSFLGSHRLRVALAILFKNSFRCPYCHEPTILEVRNRSQYQSYSRD